MLGTNIDADNLSDEEGIAAYKAQSQVASGFRFLKDALFIVSSLFVKKPSRIQGLLMVMTLATGWRNVACDRNEPVKRRAFPTKSINRRNGPPYVGSSNCSKGFIGSV